MKRLTNNELDALEAALAKAKPISYGKLIYIVSRGYEHLANLCGGDMGPITMTYRDESDAIAAAYNALPALLAELRELRRLTTPEPITEKHRDGNWWLMWEPQYKHWFKARWRHEVWDLGWQSLRGVPAHALPLPPAPEGEL